MMMVSIYGAIGHPIVSIGGVGSASRSREHVVNVKSFMLSLWLPTFTNGIFISR